MINSRRNFLRNSAALAGAASALGLLPASIRRALAIPANNRTGTIRDVEHIVIFMQENRSFDHYFGALPGVRGFGDRFPIPVPDQPGIKNSTVWTQFNDHPGEPPRTVLPFHLNTQQVFEYMRVASTPHTWSNSQDAWSAGQMNRWPVAKKNHSMAYFTEEDLPFQYALARSFTVCDAYHASFTGGTNTNRLFLWTGTNDGLGKGNGPALGNTYNKLKGGDPNGGYTWTTYPERLESAGISWRIYQDMKDNYSLNPMAGFRAYRDAYKKLPGSNAALKEKALTTRDLDLLRQDVLDNKLPQVTWICATKAGSEHPSPSSPAQGADYTSHVLDALTSNPEVWSKTVLLLMYDENDGFFDHAPPPAPPSYSSTAPDAKLAGESTVDTAGEYHTLVTGVEKDDTPAHLNGVYGLGARVPMYILSPWTKGGWVNSEVFDHTSVLRFVEQRFGVLEQNISPWRRAVCGDLSSAFNFVNPNDINLLKDLPSTAAQAARAAALPGTTIPSAPASPVLARQASGTRPARALPYALHTQAKASPTHLDVSFINQGQASAVFHVYDQLHLERIPRRYTVEPGKQLQGRWTTKDDDGHYALWILGPNGFHRHYTGATRTSTTSEIELQYAPEAEGLHVDLHNTGSTPRTFHLAANAYYPTQPFSLTVAPGDTTQHRWTLSASSRWYDFTVTVDGDAHFARRFAGHVENGKPSISDPAMGGEIVLAQVRPADR